MSEITEDQTASPPGPGDRVRGTGRIASKVPLALTIAIALIFHLQMRDMEVGSLVDPGPGFWPRLLIVGIIVVSLMGLLADLTGGIEPFELEGTARVLGGFATLVVFVFLFQATGAILAGFIFMMLWLKGLNGESWRLSLILSGVAPLVAYLLFVVALGVRLPEDVVASIWGGR